MTRDSTAFLWLLKLGAVANLGFLAASFFLRTDAAVLLPAQILFAVSAYRCLFPVRYEDNVVFHETAWSSIFITRALATFAEVAYIFLFSEVLRRLNRDHVDWIEATSWLMVAAVVISQVFVWAAVLSGWRELYFYEELGWAILFAANTVASAWLLATDSSTPYGLLRLNLLFGCVYLPWQLLHLRKLWLDARGAAPQSTTLRVGLARAVRVMNRRTDSAAWGGWIGMSWMIGYWATLIPAWVFHIARSFAQVSR